MKNMRKKATILVMVCVLISALALSLTACGNKKTTDGNYLEKDTSYNLKEVSVMGFDIVGLSILKTANLTLTADGKMNMKIVVDTDKWGNIGDIISKISGMFNTDAKGAVAGESLDTATPNAEGDPVAPPKELDISGIMKAVVRYAEQMFPGFKIDTVENIQNSFTLIEKSLGLKFIGVDWTNAQGIALANVLISGKVPMDFVIPSGFGLEFNGIYRLETLHGADNKEYKAVLVGFNEILDDPFILLTLDNDEYGKARVRGEIKFVQLKINGYPVA
ncbi:MAG: hypothetical protein RR405_04915 [Clostridia bacterium]